MRGMAHTQSRSGRCICYSMASGGWNTKWRTEPTAVREGGGVRPVAAGGGQEGDRHCKRPPIGSRSMHCTGRRERRPPDSLPAHSHGPSSQCLPGRTCRRARQTAAHRNRLGTSRPHLAGSLRRPSHPECRRCTPGCTAIAPQLARSRAAARRLPAHRWRSYPIQQSSRASLPCLRWHRQHRWRRSARSARLVMRAREQRCHWPTCHRRTAHDR